MDIKLVLAISFFIAVLIYTLYKVWYDWRGPGRSDSPGVGFGGASKGLEEASFNWDSKLVGPLLENIAKHIDSGFPPEKVSETARMIVALDHNETAYFSFYVVYKGREVEIRMEAFMDDIDSPDFIFFTDPELAKDIESEMEQLSEKLLE